MKNATTETRRTSQSHRVPLIAGAIASLLIVVAIACAPRSARLDVAERTPFNPHAALDDVKWNEERVARDPRGAIGWSQLSASYLNLSRQTDDNSYALKAESAARQSLALRRTNNVNAAVRLAKSILDQHRFADALSAVNDALKMDPSDQAAQGLHAEILVEIGRYDDAWRAFDQYRLDKSGLSGYVLKARLLEIDGKPDEAEVMLREATTIADQDWDLSRESAAWYHLKLGSLLWNAGKLMDAKEQFEIAVDLNPRDFKSLGGLAKIAAAERDLNNAKKWAEQSISVVPSVEVASLLEDLAARENKNEDKAKYSTLIDTIGDPHHHHHEDRIDPHEASSPESVAHTHNRLHAMYCADHKTELSVALSAAREDLEARKDVFAYDTLAWVLHQMSRDDEALAMMNKALARGTRDAKMLYHSGMIHSALGHTPLARQELETALSINPQFQFLHADIARKELMRISDAATQAR